MRNFLAILQVRNIELFRDKSIWIWNVIFPIILVVLVAMVFKGQDGLLYKVGMVGEEHASTVKFKETEYIKFIDYVTAEEALSKLKYHQIDLVIDVGKKMQYWINDSSPQGYLVEKIFLGVDQGKQFIKGTISGQQIRYVDWVLPGVLGINILNSALTGVGMVVVRYRKNGVLKRLGASPLSAFEFLSAQVLSRLFILLLVTVFLFFALDLIFDILVRGSYGLLFFVTFLGTMTMISLGLLFASRISSEEAATGMLNLLILPMIFLSEVWFSLEGAPDFLQKIALAFPLTHLLNAARSIMTDGAGIMEILPEIGILTGMMLLFLTVASLRFKWGEDY